MPTTRAIDGSRAKLVGLKDPHGRRHNADGTESFRLRIRGDPGRREESTYSQNPTRWRDAEREASGHGTRVATW